MSETEQYELPLASSDKGGDANEVVALIAKYNDAMQKIDQGLQNAGGGGTLAPTVQPIIRYGEITTSIMNWDAEGYFSGAGDVINVFLLGRDHEDEEWQSNHAMYADRSWRRPSSSRGSRSPRVEGVSASSP